MHVQANNQANLQSLLNIPKMEVQFRLNATLTDTISRLRCETEIQLMGSLSDTHVC